MFVHSCLDVRHTLGKEFLRDFYVGMLSSLGGVSLCFADFRAIVTASSDMELGARMGAINRKPCS